MKVYGFLIVLICCGSYQANGQNIRIDGHLISQSEPVAYAHIYLKDFESNTFIGTVSDLLGVFHIDIPLKHATDTLHISCLGFEPENILLKRIMDKPDIIVELRPSTTVLPMFTVRDLSAEEFLLKCIQRVPDNYLDVSFVNTCFYWQTIRENDDYKTLNQSYLTILETNAEATISRRIRKDSLLIPANPASPIHFLDSIENILYFDFVRSASSFMNAENLKEWRFTYDTQIGLPENIVLINATRLDNHTDLKLFINSKDYSFEQIKYLYTWKPGVYHSLNDSLLYTMGKLEGKILYTRNVAKYNMKYLFAEVEYDVYKKLTYKKQYSRTLANEIVVTSSVESERYPVKNWNAKTNKPRTKIVVNKIYYCEAAKALEIDPDDQCH